MMTPEVLEQRDLAADAELKRAIVEGDNRIMLLRELIIPVTADLEAAATTWRPPPPPTTSMRRIFELSRTSSLRGTASGNNGNDVIADFNSQLPAFCIFCSVECGGRFPPICLQFNHHR